MNVTGHFLKFGALALLLIISPSWAKKDKDVVDPELVRKIQAEISQLKKENKKLDKDLAHADSMMTEEASRTAKLHENYEKQLSRKKEEIQEIKNSLTQIQTQISQEKSKQASFQNKSDEIKAREQSNKKLLLQIAAKLEERITGSLPWDIEKRLERIRVLKRDMETNNASLDEILVRLTSIYKDEIKLGDEITLQDQPVTRKNGEVINARVLKMGNQWMVYSDEEEKNFGVLSRTQTAQGVSYTWKEDLDFKEREAVRAALDIKSGKKPPGLVTLPLSLAINPASQTKQEGL